MEEAADFSGLFYGIMRGVRSVSAQPNNVTLRSEASRSVTVTLSYSLMNR